MIHCEVKGCKRVDIAVEYLGKLVCNKCWDKYACLHSNDLRAVVGLKAKEVSSEGVVEVDRNTEGAGARAEVSKA